MEYRKINGRDYLVWNRIEANDPDLIAIHMLEQNEPQGLLPFRWVRQETGQYFRYSCQKGILLSQWLEKTQRKNNVIHLLLGLTAMEEELEEYLLEPGKMDTEPDSVLVENDRCLFAYLPVRKYQGGNLLDLTKRILESVRYAMDEDYTYLFDLYNALGRRDIRNMAELKKWLKNISVEESKRRDISFEKEEKIDHDLPLEHMEAEKAVNKKGGLFGRRGRKSPVEEHSAELERKTGEIKDREEEKQNLDRTVLYYEAGRYGLLRASTGEIYQGKREECVIGTSDSADLRIAGVRTISRNHARIYASGGEMWLEDLGSSNGTYLNGELLEPMKKYRLQNGDRITLANEEFSFQM